MLLRRILQFLMIYLIGIVVLLLIKYTAGLSDYVIPGPGAVVSTAREVIQRYMGDVLVQEGEESPVRIGETFSRQLDFYSGSTRVRMLYFGPAHTEGDAVVFIPSEKVAFLGDLIFLERDPLIHTHKNGSSLGLVKVLKSVLELDADIFLHGHGAPAGKSEIQGFVASLVKKQEEIRALIEEGKTIREICQELRGPVFPIYTKLFELYQNGLIQIAGRKVAAKETPPPVREKPFDNEEDEIRHLYEHVLPQSKAAKLLIKLQSLQNKSLSAEEAFIISRINEDWDIRSIVMVSPFQEVTTLRILKKFLDDKIIALH